MPANHRVQAATPMPADPAGRPSQPVGKPDGQPAGSDAREPDRAQLPSARTMRDIRAAHPDSADKHALRERMDRLENRGAHVSRRALIAEVRREQTEPTNAQEVYSLPEPVADTRPLPVVHHADVDEHPLDSGSVDVVAMYASDAQDDLDPCCLFAETVLRPGGVLLLCCEVGAGVAVAIAYEVCSAQSAASASTPRADGPAGDGRRRATRQRRIQWAATRPQRRRESRVVNGLPTSGRIVRRAEQFLSTAPHRRPATRRHRIRRGATRPHRRREPRVGRDFPRSMEIVRPAEQFLSTG